MLHLLDIFTFPIALLLYKSYYYKASRAYVISNINSIYKNKSSLNSRFNVNIDDFTTYKVCKLLGAEHMLDAYSKTLIEILSKVLA